MAARSKLKYSLNVSECWLRNVVHWLLGSPSHVRSQNSSLLQSEMSIMAPAICPSAVSPVSQPAVPHVTFSRSSDAPLGQRKNGSFSTEAGTHSANPSVQAQPAE